MTWLQLGQGPVMPAMACGTVRAVPQAALDITQPVEHLGILFFDGEGGEGGEDELGDELVRGGAFRLRAPLAASMRPASVRARRACPCWKKIPGLKWLFKYKNRSKNHKNLMLFITPNLIGARDGGLPAEPQSVVPQRPSRYLPTKPCVDCHKGALANAPPDLPYASRYLSRETDKLENLVNQNLITEETGQKLRELKVATEQLAEQCQQLKLTHHSDFAIIDQNELVLKGVLDRIGRETRKMFTKKYF